MCDNYVNYNFLCQFFIQKINKYKYKQATTKLGHFWVNKTRKELFLLCNNYGVQIINDNTPLS
jgi:hypothetical protein